MPISGQKLVDPHQHHQVRQPISNKRLSFFNSQVVPAKAK